MQKNTMVMHVILEDGTEREKGRKKKNNVKQIERRKKVYNFICY